jgi:hypothetical protein
MKLQLDTTMKIIRVEGTVSLLELSETLERLLPNGVWKTFSLECGTTIIWSQPIQIYPTWPYYPWWTPPVNVPYYGSTTISYALVNDSGNQVTYTLEQGTFNIEI